MLTWRTNADAYRRPDNRLAKLLDRGPLKKTMRKQYRTEVPGTSLTKSLNVTVHYRSKGLCACM